MSLKFTRAYNSHEPIIHIIVVVVIIIIIINFLKSGTSIGH